ncbi:MAG: hypothetical protein AAGH53_03465 [Pseudomonadota bacterium]
MAALATADNFEAAAQVATQVVEDSALGYAFIHHWLAALDEHPLIVLDCPVNRSGNTVSAVLYQNRQITLSLVSLWSDIASETISFSKGATIFAPIHAVSAQMQCWYEDKAQGGCQKAIRCGEPIPLSTRAICIDTNREAMQLLAADQPVLLLRITLAPPDRSGQLQRHYATKQGQLLRVTAADPLETRQMLLLAALRAMGAERALPQMLKACDQPLSALRWQAMRECLATDMLGALPQLETMAAEDDDAQIRVMASALIKQIAHKQKAA